MEKHWSDHAADAIINELKSRKGIGDELDQIDRPTLKEIKAEIATIILRARSAKY